MAMTKFSSGVNTSFSSELNNTNAGLNRQIIETGISSSRVTDDDSKWFNYTESDVDESNSTMMGDTSSPYVVESVDTMSDGSIDSNLWTTITDSLATVSETGGALRFGVRKDISQTAGIRLDGTNAQDYKALAVDSIVLLDVSYNGPLDDNFKILFHDGVSSSVELYSTNTSFSRKRISIQVDYSAEEVFVYDESDGSTLASSIDVSSLSNWYVQLQHNGGGAGSPSFTYSYLYEIGHLDNSSGNLVLQTSSISTSSVDSSVIGSRCNDGTSVTVSPKYGTGSFETATPFAINDDGSSDTSLTLKATVAKQSSFDCSSQVTLRYLNYLAAFYE